MSAKKETLFGTVGIVVAVCLACSIVVSSSAVGLKQLQNDNASLDKKTNILTAAGLLKDVSSRKQIEELFEQRVDEKYVDLQTGEYVDKPSGDYDMYKAAKSPEYSVDVSDGKVGFKQRASIATVYLVTNAQGAVDRIVLPVHGSGLWDLMYGFLAIDSDGHTIRELIYYKHKETPGLGAEVLNPVWQAKWNGKQLYKDGEVAIKVAKNAGNDNQYAVDALSGATLTSNGVQNTLVYWAGENGYGKYLKNQSWKS